MRSSKSIDVFGWHETDRADWQIALAVCLNSSDMPRISLVILVLVLLAAAIYSPVRRFGFIEYDDPTYIYQNPDLHRSVTLESVRYAFAGHVGTWNPLVWMSFHIDRFFFDLRPGPMHVENVALHLVGSILLLIVLMDATGSIWRSGMVAALFLCHPMHVESVAWITERKDVLSTPLLFAAIAGYIRYTRAATKTRRVLWYGGMLVCFVLSLMAKSMGLTLPAVLLLLDYWPLRRMVARSIRRLLWEKLPLLVICVVVAVIAAHAQHIAGAASSLTTLSLTDRVENAILAYVIYVTKLLAPRNLAVFYPHPQSIAFSQVAAAGILLLIITAGTFRLRGRQPYLWIGWLWFIGTLVPVIGLVQIGAQALADRYSYFPSVGLFIALVWGVSDVGSAVVRSVRLREAIVGIGAAVYVILISVLARQQVGYWKDTQTLFTHAQAVTEDNWVAHLSLGNVALENGDIASAKDEFLKVIELQPRNAKAYNNLAECVVRQTPENAVAIYEKAVEYDPTAPEYHVNLAAALVMTGQREAAVRQCREALKLQPGFAPALAGLADLSAANETTRP
jgi:hypothetical protein